MSSRANARDLAREWLERGGQDPSRSLGMKILQRHTQAH